MRGRSWADWFPELVVDVGTRLRSFEMSRRLGRSAPPAVWTVSVVSLVSRRWYSPHDAELRPLR